jgi:uncharacterized protein
MELKIRNNTFVLLPQKALYWKEHDILLISDLHIGKIGHFRKSGIALPPAAAQENFARLDEIITTTNASQILFVGDLFHSDANHEWNQFCAWRKQYPTIKMDIVPGNHDRLPDNFCAEFQITIHPIEWMIDGFTFTHYPREEFTTDEYVISGHVHPVISLSGLARQHIRVPCFYFGTQQAILPSFGYFTGGYAIDIQKTDSVIAVVNDTLIPVQLASATPQL